MVKLHTFVVENINEITSAESTEITDVLKLNVATPLNGCTSNNSDEVCAQKLKYFAIMGKQLVLDFKSDVKPEQKCGQEIAGSQGREPELERIWLADAQLAQNTIPENLVCPHDSKNIITFMVIGLNELEHVLPLSSHWESLKALMLSRVNLKSIPTEIGELPKLARLTVTSTASRAPGGIVDLVPATLSGLGRLEKLHLELTHSQGSLDAGFFSNMPSLKGLTLKLKLETFPESICSLASLQKLKLQHNPIGVLPSCLAGLNKLTSLDLTNSSLTTLPNSLNSFKNLKELVLDKNSLATLPNSLSSLSLTTLGLTGVRGLFVPSAHPICLARNSGNYPGVEVCSIYGDNTVLFTCQTVAEGCICRRSVPTVDDMKQKECEQLDDDYDAEHGIQSGARGVIAKTNSGGGLTTRKPLVGVSRKKRRKPPVT